jgi:hypothetical protein
VFAGVESIVLVLVIACVAMLTLQFYTRWRAAAQ